LVAPFFTPPWNRCTPETGLLLVELGYELLSRDGGEPPLDLAGLLEMPIRVDWLRRPPGRPHDHAALAARLAGEVCNPRPVGVMLHHARMDGEERSVLGELLALLTTAPTARCCSMRSLALELSRGQEFGP